MYGIRLGMLRFLHAIFLLGTIEILLEFVDLVFQHEADFLDEGVCAFSELGLDSLEGLMFFGKARNETGNEICGAPEVGIFIIDLLDKLRELILDDLLQLIRGWLEEEAWHSRQFLDGCFIGHLMCKINNNNQN